ncbi:Low affinity potassium transport system protein kup [mine drainage metagenome]|uniref:Low affinity potassium transport system protein kup n=1 Tax=mine drainage metagenome TaxID=410659 RepID=A0A1J5R0M8_9ZZZZ
MSHEGKPRNLALSLGALGIVYGDIGTSPLYAFQSAFGNSGVTFNPEHVFGILSLIFWALVLMVSVKYVALVLRADNGGEGGILALMALVMRRYAGGGRKRVAVIMLGLAGAAMFYGDSVITPAISVLSAVEGLSVATPVFAGWEVPITMGILVGLFVVQRTGTHGIGRWFGPLMLLWFGAIGVFGAMHIVHHPEVLAALNPLEGAVLVVRHPGLSLVLLGAVFLVITGGEALYADMGHFGRRPIQLAWSVVVLPALLLNYFGQGAAVLGDPRMVKNPFFMMLPHATIWPMLLLATAATVIASQAVISGAYSMTAQAIKLGYLPRIPVIYTNAEQRGQIYIPFINWLLMLFVLALVAIFRNADALANAYGLAVNVTMLVTTLFCWSASLQKWGWGARRAALVWGSFLTLDLLFLLSNSLKVVHGGWFPILFGAVIYTLLATWKDGRRLLRRHLRDEGIGLEDFIASLTLYPPKRVEGTAIYLTPDLATVPHALLHNLKHNKVLHERTLFLSARTADVPHVDPAKGISLKDLGDGVYLLHVDYGFQDTPDIVRLLADMERLHEMEFHLMETSFFLARQTIIPARLPGMAPWREILFSWMSRNAQAAADYFRIPPNRVVELGTQVEI